MKKTTYIIGALILLTLLLSAILPIIFVRLMYN